MSSDWSTPVFLIDHVTKVINMPQKFIPVKNRGKKLVAEID